MLLNDATAFLKEPACKFPQLLTPLVHLKETLKRHLVAERSMIVNWNKPYNLLMGRWALPQLYVSFSAFFTKMYVMIKAAISAPIIGAAQYIQ